MRVIFSTSPTPQLLNSAVTEPREIKPLAPLPPLPVNVTPSVDTTPRSSGNGRAIFARIVLGVAVLLAAALVYSRHQSTTGSEKVVPGVITIAIPGEGKVSITPALIHVTAISLGNPRLALINGQQVAEGDHVTLRLASPAAVVKLEVKRIADGEVDLGDGAQVISARVEAPIAKKPKRP